MKVHMTVTIDVELLRKIDEFRGAVKRSTFVEQLLKDAMEKRRADNRKFQSPAVESVNFKRLAFE